LKNLKRTSIVLLACLAVVVAVVTAKFMLDESRGNAIIMRKVDAANALGGKPGVEVELYSPRRAFPVIDSLVVLQIGSKVFNLSKFKNGDTHTLVFTLTPEEFDGTRNESLISVHYEPDTQGHWDFGFLEKKWITGQRR